MSFEEDVKEFKKIQNRIQNYIEGDDNEINFEDLESFLNYIKNQNFFLVKKIILEFIASLSNNHIRQSDFYTKIERILKIFINEIKSLSNQEIFNIFGDNKRLLLFLIEQKMFVIDEKIAKLMMSIKLSDLKYDLFFGPELKTIIKEKSQHWEASLLEKIELTSNQDDFYLKRKKGENDDFLCQLIRNDSIDDFIIYVNKTNLSLNSLIPESIFETNSLLLTYYNRKKHRFSDLSLINYAAFFGSMQIFKYLVLNDVKINPSIWIYAIHGANPEMLHFLEELKIEPEDKSFQQCYEESIKCHHNSIAEYISNNLLQSENSFIKQYLKYCNFYFVQKIEINNDAFFYICQYDYYYFLEYFLNSKLININYEKCNEKTKKYKWLAYHKNKETALNKAIIKGNNIIIKTLLKQKEIDVNIPSICQKSPDKFENFEEYEDWKKERIKTALIYAAEKGNVEAVRMLLEKENIDVNFQSEKNSLLGMVKIVYWTKGDEWRNGDVYTQCKETALTIAIQNRNVEITRLLLNHKKINPNLQYLYVDNLGAGSSSDSYYMNKISTLNLAAASGNVDIFKLLVNHEKIDLNASSFDYANYENLMRDLDYPYDDDLLDEICCIEKSILETVVGHNSIDLVRFLLNNKKIDINDNIAKKSFFCAIEKNNVKMLNLLLQQLNIDVNAKSYNEYDNSERTALFCAVYNGNIDVIKVLLAQKSIFINDTSIVEEDEMTALFYAIKNKNIEIVKLLLEQKNIDVDAINIVEEEETTALFYAIENKDIEIIKLLLEHGNIDVDEKIYLNDDKITPLDFAIQKGDPEIISLFKNKKVNHE